MNESITTRPKVTDPLCRLPLPAFISRQEAEHLGDLLRILGTVKPGPHVRSAYAMSPRTIFQVLRSTLDTPTRMGAFCWPSEPFPSRPVSRLIKLGPTLPPPPPSPQQVRVERESARARPINARTAPHRDPASPQRHKDPLRPKMGPEGSITAIK